MVASTVSILEDQESVLILKTPVLIDPEPHLILIIGLFL